MSSVPVVVTVPEHEARALLRMIQTDLEQRICWIRDGLLKATRLETGLPSDEVPLNMWWR